MRDGRGTLAKLRLQGRRSALWVAVAYCGSHACSQQITATLNGPFDEATDRSAKPFTVAGQSSETQELFGEFRRNVDRKTWDRAFQAIDKFPSQGEGLLATSDGLLLPLSRMLVVELERLPPDGQEAYRLFYDAQAQRLWEQAQGADEASRLETIFSQYFLTSVGDRAADRLGDLCFEQGDLQRAIDCWSAVIESHPATNLSKALLAAKCAVALARSDRRDELTALVRSMESRYPGERVTLGGQEVVAAEYAANLLASLPQPEPITAGPTANGAGRLPREGEAPLWQFRYFGPRELRTFEQLRQNYGGQPLGFLQLVPPTVVTKSRLYGNLVGRLFALDLETGKLVWRTDDFSKIIEPNNNQPPFLIEQDTLTLAGGRLWAIVRAAGDQTPPSFELQCRDPDTGDAIWTSETVAGLKSWRFCGLPWADEDSLYVTANSSGNKKELHLLSLSPVDGAVVWDAVLGTHAADQQEMQWSSSAQPRIAVDRAGVYVDTHAGVVLRLARDDGQITWAANYDSLQTNQNYYYGAMQTAPIGPPLLHNGVLYVKGMSSNRVIALDTRGPSWVWKRPAPLGWSLVGVAGDRLLVCGEELGALKIADRSLQWAAKVPRGTGWASPVVDGSRLYQFTPRGVFELDLSTGDTLGVFRGADLASLGGQLHFAPNLLITVSNTAITAYPLPSNEAPAAAGAHPEPAR